MLERVEIVSRYFSAVMQAAEGNGDREILCVFESDELTFMGHRKRTPWRSIGFKIFCCEGMWAPTFALHVRWSNNKAISSDTLWSPHATGLGCRR